MLIIDISINREIYPCSIGVVRIKPKEGKIEVGEMCTYKYGYVGKGGRIEEELGKTDFEYGDALLLSNHILQKVVEKEEEKKQK